MITGSAADAEDATQDAFLAAHSALGRFRSGAPLRPWLLRIVANAARNRRRSAFRRAGLGLRLTATAPTADPAHDPEDVVAAAEQRAALLSAIDALNRDDREVIVCRFFLELSVEETARALGCAEGTVKSRLSRALTRVRVRLEQPS